MSIGLLALPLPVRFSSVSALALVLSYCHLTLPARFVPPPPSIARIKISRRANEAQEQERRTEVTVAQWPNVWDRSAILAIASLTHSLTHSLAGFVCIVFTLKAVRRAKNKKKEYCSRRLLVPQMQWEFSPLHTWTMMLLIFRCIYSMYVSQAHW